MKGKPFMGKVKLAVSILAIISVIGLVQYKRYEIATRGVEVVLGDKSVGVVKTKSEVLGVIKEIEKDLSEEYSSKIKLNEKIELKDTHIKNQDLASKDDIKKNIKDNSTFSAVCYEIKVDNEKVAYVKTEELANKAIKEVEKSFVDEPKNEEVKVEDVKILEDIEVVETKRPVEDVSDIDTTIEKLQTGNSEEVVHVMKQDENYWTMSLDYEIDMEEIEKANPDKDARNIKPGEEVIVPVAKPFVTVSTIEEQKDIKDIEFDTEYEIDNTLYKDEQKVKVEGVKGQVETISKVEKHNGKEVSREVLSETVLSEPVTQIVLKGTKERPINAPTGTFQTPARGGISSGFGRRWGRLHAGLDIAARIGTPISAADGGTVISAGFNNGGYGYMVDISHGNGYVTRYAHCSKLYVTSGQKVAKGDVIAAVGSTGRSTGPHLHFEVRKNGVPQNPTNYLK